MIKTGYFRIKTDKHESFLAYDEFYALSPAAKARYKESYESGAIKLYCGCCETDDLPLMITKDFVVRVMNNNTRSLHKSSCPKSEYYASYSAATAANGIFFNEDLIPIMNVTMPTGIKSDSQSSSVSESESTNHKTNVLEMVKFVNKKAWQQQTFSIFRTKKQKRKEESANGRIKMKTIF